MDEESDNNSTSDEEEDDKEEEKEKEESDDETLGKKSKPISKASKSSKKKKKGGKKQFIDDEAEEEDINHLLMTRNRNATVSLAANASADETTDPDMFMHALEVEAQARLTWRLHPVLCAKIFGSAHCPDASNLSISLDAASRDGWSVFFQRAIPVPPSRFRPPMSMGSMNVEHSQNHYLNKMLELNDRIRTCLAGVKALESEMTALGDGDGSDKATKQKAQLKSDQDSHQARSLSSWIDLQTSVNCFVDSSKDPTGAGASGDVPSGIRQLLEKKEGIFRKHMMGKRVNFACRSVISPDPYIGTNEIGVPLHFAKTLTYPTPVCPRNVEEMRKLVERGPDKYPGARWVEWPDGRRVELNRMDEEKRRAVGARLLSGGGTGGAITRVGRQLRDGDVVLMNRQPTLHKPGIMGHHVRVLYNPTQTTLRMHYANCNTYNADYDGDEMNCHFPQNDIGRAEAEHICATDLQYIVPTDGSPLRGLIQDHVDAGVKLTGKDCFLEKWEYQQLLFATLVSLPGLEVIESDQEIELLPPAIRRPRELWTGKQVISTLLHHLRKTSDRLSARVERNLPGVSCERKAKTPATAFGEFNEEHLTIVRDGELLRGVLDKAAFGSTDFSLVHAVYEAYGPTKAGLFLNALGRLFTAYLQYYSGHSCRMEDLVLTPEADEERRAIVRRTYNLGTRAAKAWADSDGGKVEIPSAASQKNAEELLKPVEVASAAAKIGELLSGREGPAYSAALDGYMQSQINPMASEIIKACLPWGLAVPFPANTFGLMVTTGAKGSTVNQSQVSCALGQQALEGRRVPRMSSGRTLPSFAPYDPNPRADGFIADRFLTGVRPQEYYFHCMAGREGLVDTAVKTSRSGYLQRCLVKHLEELKVGYDSTVRDGEGGVVQFLYGEDGVDPTKAAHLDCSSSTLQYMARNHDALTKRYSSLPHNTIDVAAGDRDRVEWVKSSSSAEKSLLALLKKGSHVKSRKLRFGSQWKRGALCHGWFDATITKIHSDKSRPHFDIKYTVGGTKAKRVPLDVVFENAGSSRTMAASSVCTLLKPGAPDPLLSDLLRDDGKHRLGSSGACVSERVAGATRDALASNAKLQGAMKSAGVSEKDFGSLVASKYSSALVAPGEAVGCIAAQSVGEPSTQMTLNTFHLAGCAGANVTLGIPRLREIIMTASRELKTPTMSVPLREGVSEREATRWTRYFTKLTLLELIASRGGITVTERLEQSMTGEWDRAYHVILKLHSEERIREAFGLGLEDVAAVIAGSFFPNLSKLMKIELKRGGDDGVASLNVEGGSSTSYVRDGESMGGAVKKAKKRAKDADEYDDEKADDEDGVTGSRFGHRKEMASYGDMDDEEKAIAKKAAKDDAKDDAQDDPWQSAMVTDGEGDSEDFGLESANTVRIDHDTNTMTLNPLRVDPSTRPLLMVGLVEQAAAKTLVRSRPEVNEAFLSDEENDRGRCLQTAGVNFSEFWNMNASIVDHDRLASNDTWALRCTYGVEAARMNIVEQIRSVFGVYGIEVDPRHLSLIADYMTYDGGYRAMNRLGMADVSSSFLQMSFETTANFMVDASLNKVNEPMMSPSANIVLGRPVRHGTGAFECFVKA
uniref:DNA-directed RNA polymerase n=1 Tax=Odontella aurita TaxID=265563 RepID=A0A7S4MUI9_9STRA